VTGYNQYYETAAAAILFYDYFLTLADEVGYTIRLALRWAYRLSCERSNTLGMGGNHWVRRGIARCTTGMH